MRAMFMPASHIADSTTSDWLAGPMVQMIFVLRMFSPHIVIVVGRIGQILLHIILT